MSGKRSHSAVSAEWLNFTQSEHAPHAAATFSRGPRLPNSLRRPSVVAGARLVALACIAGVVTVVVHEYRERAQTLEHTRATLQLRIDHARAQIPQASGQLPATAFAWLERESGTYLEDVTAAQLRDRQAQERALTAPSLYVRISTTDAATQLLAPRAVAESQVDAFASCWLHPPAGVSEKVLFQHVTSHTPQTGAGSVNEPAAQSPVEETSHSPTTINPLASAWLNPRIRPTSLHRLHEALFTLELLNGSLVEQVSQAKSLPALEQAQTLWERANVEAHVPATHANTLLAVLDEPKLPGTLVELDGASNHYARVVLVDLSTQTVLLRQRQHVETTWISERRRPQYSSRLTGCRLAYDVLTQASATTAL